MASFWRKWNKSIKRIWTCIWSTPKKDARRPYLVCEKWPWRREKERKCLAKLHRMCGWTKKVLLKGQYSVQSSYSTVLLVQREVFLQKITSFRNLLTEKRKNGPRKASSSRKGSHQSLQNFFQDRFSFLLTFWKRRARSWRARECLLVN